MFDKTKFLLQSIIKSSVSDNNRLLIYIAYLRSAVPLLRLKVDSILNLNLSTLFCSPFVFTIFKLLAS